VTTIRIGSLLPDFGMNSYANFFFRGCFDDVLTIPTLHNEEKTTMPELKMGAVLWSQANDWDGFLSAAQRADELGYDSIWTWDHLYAIFGEPHQPIVEGYTALAGLAMGTERAALGLLVGANTFRNPGLVAKSMVTIDHMSRGRAILGLGGAWFGLEHTAFGMDFGTGFGQRLDWMDEATGAIRSLLDGESVTSTGDGRYRFDDLSLTPGPVQDHLPIMIGGSGERKTLRTVARYADQWNAFGSPETLTHKDAVLRAHCDAVGRDPDEIERTVGAKIVIRDTEGAAQQALEDLMEHNQTSMSHIADDHTFWIGTADQIAERMVAYRQVGFHTFLVEMPAPYDRETMDALIEVVKPAVASAS
jgi:alkanesulfonate monooxygenase SsuD/methylene tetrahydromethanopterin reductase-like flavin-dependent oxidoreductase (luciferase family)